MTKYNFSQVFRNVYVKYVAFKYSTFLYKFGSIDTGPDLTDLRL